jgi:hypothetical protein
LDSFTPDTVLLRPASPSAPRSPPTRVNGESPGNQNPTWKQLSRSKRLKISGDATFPALGYLVASPGKGCGEAKASADRAGRMADRLHLNHDPGSCHGAYMARESRRNTEQDSKNSITLLALRVPSSIEHGQVATMSVTV